MADVALAVAIGELALELVLGDAGASDDITADDARAGDVAVDGADTSDAPLGSRRPEPPNHDGRREDATAVSLLPASLALSALSAVASDPSRKLASRPLLPPL